MEEINNLICDWDKKKKKQQKKKKKKQKTKKNKNKTKQTTTTNKQKHDNKTTKTTPPPPPPQKKKKKKKQQKNPANSVFLMHVYVNGFEFPLKETEYSWWIFLEGRQFLCFPVCFPEHRITSKNLR